MTKRLIIAVLLACAVLGADPLPPFNRGTGIGYAFPAGNAQGTTAYLTVPYNCTITGWYMTVSTGTATVDVWKVAAGSGLPTISNTITASATPAVSSGTTNSTVSPGTGTLTGWTTSVHAGDTMAFYLSAVSGGGAQSLVLLCQ